MDTTETYIKRPDGLYKRRYGKSWRLYYGRKCNRCFKPFFADKCSADTNKKFGRYCSRKCSAGKGKSHSNWKGGSQIYGGYKYLWNPSHPNSNKRHYVAEHILVMTTKIGRPLKKGETIHHKDGNKLNNKISNLELLTRSEHMKRHHAKDAGVKSGVSRRRKNLTKYGPRIERNG